MASGKKSFLNIYRLIFTLFSLLIMGDAFNRWDGIKYYASFPEFLPSISLITILLSIFAVFIAFSIWLVSRSFTAIRIQITAEQVFLFICFLAALSSLLYAAKPLFKSIAMTYNIKLTLLAAILSSSFLMTWFCRSWADRLIERVNEHISPLVWMFGIFAVISIPIVAYSTWHGGPADQAVQVSRPGEPGTNRPNILLVTFDAMTTLDMSAYGYHRPTTPFISEWSEKASKFSKVQAESNYTTPTTTSLMTSKRVWSHQTYFVEVASDVAGRNNENLPYILKKNGYTNIALQQIHRASVRKLGIADNFDIVLGPDKFSYSTNIYTRIDNLLYPVFGEKIILYDWIIKEDFIFFKLLNKVLGDSSVTTQPAENAFNRALEIMDSGLQEPFFIWIHLFAPHDPYLPPVPFMAMYDKSPELRTWKSQMRGDNIRQIKLFRARYDEFITYADSRFEHFMEKFQNRSASGNSLIIVSSDHGESFEHNYKGHGGPHLYEQVTNIPLIIKEPGQNKGMAIDDLAEQIDITPTILELADIPVPSWMEGRSLVPLMDSKELEPRPAFSMALDANPGRDQKITKGTIAVWEGDHKLIHYLETQRSLLFNLADDPLETSNIFDRDPETGDRLLRLIKDGLNKANERIGAGSP